MDNVELKDNGLSQFTHMTQIKQFYCSNCNGIDLADLTNLKNIKRLVLEGNVKNISSISDLQQLIEVKTTGVSDVLKYLPNSDNLYSININDESIKDINYLKKYPNLKEVVLAQSQIDISQLGNLLDLKAKGITIIFDQTNIKEQLEQKEYRFKEEDLKAIKSILGLPENVPLNDYELFNIQGNRNQILKIENIEVLNKIIQSGLLSNDSIFTKLTNIEGIDIIVENLNGISLDTIKYISESKNKKFRFVTRTLNGIDSELLEQLSENSDNLGFFIQGDALHFQNYPKVTGYESKNIYFRNLDVLVPYRLHDMKELLMEKVL